MTRNSENTETQDKRRIISYEPSPENLDFLEGKKKGGVPYNFTIDKAVEKARKRKAA
jgi:hypothetical protein